MIPRQMITRLSSGSIKNSTTINKYCKVPKNSRNFSKQPIGNRDKPAEKKGWSQEEIDAFKAKVKAEESAHKILVPEKNLTFTSPAFWVLTALTGALCAYNWYNEEEYQTKVKEREAKIAVKLKSGWRHQEDDD